MITRFQAPADLSKETPLMRQYWDIKSAHNDKVLFFRMGDFFEMFFDDALIAAPLVGIALTSRNKKGGDETPMCGIPHHAVSGPINKLLSLGYKVAICDQIEDPKLAKGLVKRAVTRVLTPGMVYDVDTLERNTSNYIASIDFTTKEICNLSFIEPSTGESFYFNDLKILEALRILNVMPSPELVVPQEIDINALKEKGIEWNKTLSFHNQFTDHGQVNLPSSARRLLSYVSSLAGESILSTLRSFEARELTSRLEVSSTSLRHLEVFYNYKGEATGTLFKAMNRTQSASGARLLKQWLSFPLRSAAQIELRQNRVALWAGKLADLKSLRHTLAELGDIERRLTRLSTPQVNARDIIAVAQAVAVGIKTYQFATQVEGAGIAINRLQELLSLSQLSFQTFKEDAPISVKQGHMINTGVSHELDEYIRLTQDSQSLLSEMESRERMLTGISSLKIRYNNVFGYYIEITNTHKEKVPANYQRKQTLANAERYCTEELIELEKKVLTAQAKRADLEYYIFEEQRKKWLSATTEILVLAAYLAELDVITGFSWLAVERKYTRPNFNQEGNLRLISSRHPAVEQEVEKVFIANDVIMQKGEAMLITGPNMAGKSTLMRQVALIVLMAQVGSFIPAREASLPLFDRLFTRIGASDQLSEGLSTFMVEMQETAQLLKQASAESLVIVDEVGRGTSTTDGLSLAQAILEHLTTQIRCHCFFATHYHELTQLEGVLPPVRNFHLAVSESGGEIKFLHSLVAGPAQKSYGVYVAELAGLPTSVTKRAKNLLRQLDSQKTKVSNQLSLLDQQSSIEELADIESATESALSAEQAKLLNELKDLSVPTMTPIEALNKLAQFQTRLLN